MKYATRLQFGTAEFAGEATLVKHDHPMGEREQFRQVRTDQEKCNPLCCEVDDQPMNCGPRADIDTLGRFIEDAYERPPMQPAAEDRLLLVAARQSYHRGVQTGMIDGEFVDDAVRDGPFPL